MKKIIIIFVSILIIVFALIWYMVWNNNYFDSLIEKIVSNTDIGVVDYINEYGDYYIVSDDKYIYLVNMKYEIVSSIDINLVYENKNGYDIIYKDGEIMYFDDKYEDDKLIYSYYNIYDYKLIDRVLVGGSGEE